MCHTTRHIDPMGGDKLTCALLEHIFFFDPSFFQIEEIRLKKTRFANRIRVFFNKKFIRSKIYPHAIQFGKSIGFYSISLPLIINVSLSYVFEFFRNEKSLFPSQSHRLTRVKRLCKANPSNLSKGEQFLSFRHSNTPHREITHHFSIGNIAILPIDRGRSSIIFIIEPLDWDRSIL